MKKLMFCTVLTAGSLCAANLNWNVLEGDFGLGANWDTGNPLTADDYGMIANGGISTLSDGDYTCQRVDLGNGGTGTLRQTGGILTCSNYPSIGYNGATGTYLLSGGTLTVNGVLRIGRRGQGIFRITGGTVYVSGNTEMGRYGEANNNELLITAGVYNQTGSNLVVGWEGSATATVSGTGTINVEPAAGIIIGNAAAAGTLNLSTGGTLVVPAISLPNASGTFVFDGGILRVNKSSPSATPLINGTGTVTISANGAFIDTQAFDATIKADITSTSGGGITKSGSGVLTLAGNNTYGGTTTVSEGTLAARGPESLPGYNQPGRVVVADGASISLGVGWTPGDVDILRANITYLGSGEVPITSDCEYDTSSGDLTISDDLTPSTGLVKSGANMLALTGHNTFVEPALVREGTLQADFGQGLDADFPVILNGGTLSSASGEITAPLGEEGSKILVPSGAEVAGFTARTVPLTVNLGGEGAPIVYNSDLFPPFTLVLNGADADQPLTLMNGLDVNGTNCYVQSYANTVTFRGDITDSVGTGRFYKNGAGQAIFSNSTDVARIYLEGTGDYTFAPGSILSGTYVKCNANVHYTFDRATVSIPSGDGFNVYNGTVDLLEGTELSVNNLRLQAGKTILYPDAVINTTTDVRLNTATFIQNGGTLNSQSTGETFRIGDGTGTTGTFILNDGEVNAAYTISLGYNGNGTLEVNGGTVNATQYIMMGHQTVSQNNILRVNGGQILMASQTKGYFAVGYRGSAFAEIGHEGYMRVPYVVFVGRGEACTNSILRLMSGGLLETAEVGGKGSAGVSRVFELNGGTLRAMEKGSGSYNTAGANLVAGLTDFVMGRQGGTIDTAGLDRILAQPMTATNDPGYFSEGLVHRWSFNGTLTDDYSDAIAVASGDFTTDGSVYTLAGGAWGTSQIDLGANLIPTEGPVTIEIWANSKSAQTNSRIFDIGDSEQDFFMANWSNGTDTGSEKFEVRFNNVQVVTNGGLGGYTANGSRQYHIAFVIEQQVDGSWIITGYKQYDTGETRATATLIPPAGWSPAVMKQSHFYLGHSQFPNDNDANVSYNEVRIWNRALSQEELSANAAAGPDSVEMGTIDPANSANGVFRKCGQGALMLTGANTFDLPTVIEEGELMLGTDASLPADQPVAIFADASLSLGGGSTTFAALTGNGTLLNGELTLTDGLYPGDDENIGTLCVADTASVTGTLHVKTNLEGESDKLVVEGPCDLSALSLEVEDLNALSPGKVYTIIEATSIQGSFAASNLSGTRWIATAHDGVVKLMTGGTLMLLN